MREGLMPGSVSQQCVHHAPCPVVVHPAKPNAIRDESKKGAEAREPAIA
jgi:hypothetical protein